MAMQPTSVKAYQNLPEKGKPDQIFFVNIPELEEKTDRKALLIFIACNSRICKVKLTLGNQQLQLWTRFLTCF